MAVGDSSSEFSNRIEDSRKTIRVSVLWKGNNYYVEIDSGASLKDLGYELIKLTGVTAETLRLIVPLVNAKGSKLIFPFSDDHSSLSLQESNIIEDKPIRMMGVSAKEVDEVLNDAVPDMRILGFEEEERRIRQKKYVLSSSIKLPQGPYIFCDFRTLDLPGINLNPPASAALKIMHRLAADPGIIAIMNKHRWRVGIMTELAPVGYVGVSPECILGFNKNQGEEISLRLRTDDLKGFRKYLRIKKTLLHELAHMVYTEHDENFFALDRQLNEEAESLDWTKSRGQTLNGTKFINDNEEDYLFVESDFSSHKLGGNQSDNPGNARELSVAAAYRRLSHASVSKHSEEPDPDDLIDVCDEDKQAVLPKPESDFMSKFEPDPDDLIDVCDEDKQAVLPKPESDFMSKFEPDPDDLIDVCDEDKQAVLPKDQSVSTSKFEPDPDDTIEDDTEKIQPGHSWITLNPKHSSPPEHPSGLNKMASDLTHEDDCEPDQDDLDTYTSIEEVKNMKLSNDAGMPDGTMQATPDLNNAEPYPENNLVETIMEVDEPDPDDEEIQRIQDSVTIISNRLKKAINVLETEVIPGQATNVLQVLLKIVRNIIEQPNNIKFRRLRKANPAIKRNILNYAAAVEILSVVGFVEETVYEEDTGAQEPYLVLKRNDPGLLWIAKSLIEESHTTRSSSS